MASPNVTTLNPSSSFLGAKSSRIWFELIYILIRRKDFLQPLKANRSPKTWSARIDAIAQTDLLSQLLPMNFEKDKYRIIFFTALDVNERMIIRIFF